MIVAIMNLEVVTMEMVDTETKTMEMIALEAVMTHRTVIADIIEILVIVDIIG
jgi:hypothetical protein